MAHRWELAAAARREFADMVESLMAEQAGARSLCGGWTVHNVAAHVSSLVMVPLPKFMFNAARAGFDFDKAYDRTAKRLSQDPIATIAANIRERADKKSVLPGFPGELTVADTVIHAQDIRRPLGLKGAPGEQSLRASLDHLTTHKTAKYIVDPRVVASVQLIATDIDWTAGSGPEVRGPAEAILMAIAGRPVTAELNGAGVAKLG